MGKHYRVAQAREHLADVLDLAEAGESVVIERRGVYFSVRAEIAVHPVRRRTPRIELVDPALEAGSWTWESSRSGELKFKRRSKH